MIVRCTEADLLREIKGLWITVRSVLSVLNECIAMCLDIN